MLRALAAVAAIFLAVYLPDIGHGFISDDFRWIAESRIQSARDLMAVFSADVGFYRPVTSLSFAADHAAWGLSPFGYGATNLVLCLAAAAALFSVARRVGLPPAPALLAAGVWLMNFHAINMSVLWLSGRTALLASLFSLTTADAVLAGRHLLAGLLALAAMLSKEEAVALPVVFTVFHWAEARLVGSGVTRTPPVVASGFSRTLPLWGAAAMYLALRAQSGAFWPANAPDYYQFSWSPIVIGRNVLEYADRAGTLFAIVTIVLILAGRLRWSGLLLTDRRVLLLAATWIAGMYALTVFLPVRSSLYALLPSIGSALAVGVIGAAAQRHDARRFRNAAIAFIVVAVLVIPVYRSRNARWVRLAELSAAVMRTVVVDAGGRPSGHVVLIDAPQERFNLASAFGNLLPEALQLHAGSGWTGEIVMPPAEASRRGDLEYRLVNGSLQREGR